MFHLREKKNHIPSAEEEDTPQKRAMRRGGVKESKHDENPYNQRISEQLR